MSTIDSLRRPAFSRKGTPQAMNSRSLYSDLPATLTATDSLPCEMTSKVASECANSTGLRKRQSMEQCQFLCDPFCRPAPPWLSDNLPVHD